MHPSNRRAFELLNDLESFEAAERDPNAQDPLTAWAAGMPQRSNSELVYKTFHTPLPSQQNAPAMDAETETKWNKWWRDNFMAHVGAVVDVVAEENACEHKRLLDEIDQLRADLTLLRAQVDGTVKKMRPDVTLRGDVA
jgi:hypothetical protein